MEVLDGIEAFCVDQGVAGVCELVGRGRQSPRPLPPIPA
jgi:hypothetical protein